MYDTNFINHLIEHDYVALNTESILFAACEKRDAGTLRLLCVNIDLTTSQRLAGANKAQELDFHEGIEIIMSSATPSAPSVPAPKRRSTGQRAKSKDIKGLSVADLKQAFLEKRARPQYALPLRDAIDGKGIKMNYGIEHQFGTGMCLKDAPLVVEDVNSVELWLKEVRKLKTLETAGQGALRAALGHFLRALHEEEKSQRAKEAAMCKSEATDDPSDCSTSEEASVAA